MIIGAMNHPAADVLEEIDSIAQMGLEFIDLTLEPPGASWRTIDADAIRSRLRQHSLHVVGHTAYYLPLGSAIECLRVAAVEEFRHCIDAFQKVGASWVNIHPDRHTPFHDREFFIARNIESIQELLPYARRAGIGLMIENLPGEFNNAEQLGELLDPIPELGLHLDLGHANLQTPHNTTAEILAAYGSRLRHVHLHDNRGGHNDLHLPLGAGTVDVRAGIHALRGVGYDGSITLEVFTPDRHFLEYSRNILRDLWKEESNA
jgi:sugar phosphate isomerase/epimerase